jgi:hypothetical protein
MSGTETIILVASMFIIPIVLAVSYMKRNEQLSNNYTQPIQEGVRLSSSSNYDNLPNATPIADANAYVYSRPYGRGGKTKRKRNSLKQSRRKK